MRVNTGGSLPCPTADQRHQRFERYNWTGEQFCQAVCDCFDVLYAEGERSARVMGLALHPYVTGLPHRSKWLDKALAYITGHDRVWLATGTRSPTGTTRTPTTRP